MAQSTYEISVAGIVPAEDLADLGALPQGGTQVNTVLYGVSDRAALDRLLAQLGALGIDVLEIRRVQDALANLEDVVERVS